jgi:protein required for attachment to host cells
MRETRIWVLITDGATARLSSTGDGATTPILTPHAAAILPQDGADAERLQRLIRNWFRSDKPPLLGAGGKGRFIGHIAQILHEAAVEAAFDGLIVIATGKALAELQMALSPATRALLVGEMVRDLPNAETVQKVSALELHH